MIRETFPVGPLQCNCTLLGDPVTGEAIVVDPGGNVLDIEARLAAHNLRLTHILVTHAHLDHIAGAHTLRQRTGAPVLYNQHDLPQLALMPEQAAWMGVATPTVAPPEQSADDDITLHLGATPIQVIHTPGHTQGSICLHLPTENLLLAGDTLFRDGVGRTDFPGGNSTQLMRSIATRLLHLPECNIVPGHGLETTLSREIERNPFLQNL